MSNPTFRTGDITREAGAPVEAFHLVKSVDGKVQPNDAGTFPFGVVTESAAPEGDRDTNYLGHGLPDNVRVQTSQRIVKIATDGDIAQDGDVFAAADGKVSAAGSVKVGLADLPTSGGVTRVHLFHPSALLSAAGGGEGNG